MARFVYAKIYCDILRHPLLRSRPDCDVRLVLGLLLEAKEHTEDGVLRHLTAMDARDFCHIKAPVAKVQAGIDYLVTSGWLIPHPDQAYEIRDFVERQGKTDPPEAQAERSQRYYESHRETILAKRKVSREKSDGLTRENSETTVRSSHAEEEGEEEEENKSKGSDAHAPVLTAVPAKPARKKAMATPEQEACRAQIRAKFLSVFAERSGGAEFLWNGAENKAIVTLAQLDRAGGVDPAKGLRALDVFIERMPLKRYYAENFAPRIVVQELNNLRVALVADTPRRGPGAAGASRPVPSAADFDRDAVEHERRLQEASK